MTINIIEHRVQVLKKLLVASRLDEYDFTDAELMTIVSNPAIEVIGTLVNLMHLADYMAMAHSHDHDHDHDIPEVEK